MSTTQVSDAMRVTTALDATKLTGNLPAISGASLTGLKSGTAAFAARSTSASWTSVADSAIIPFNDDSTADSFDTDGVYNTSTYKFTAPATGVYMFWYSIYTADSDTENGFCFLKNSAKINLQYNAGPKFLSYALDNLNDHIQAATIITPLASGDTMAACAAAASDCYLGYSQWGGCRLA